MIPTLWLNRHPGVCHPQKHWDVSIFRELILGHALTWTGTPRGDWPEQAVVMIAGRFHAQDVTWLNYELQRLDGCVVVVHSDEESLLDWSAIQHPNMRRWVMTPPPDTKPTEGVRFIGEGWSPKTPELLASLPNPPRNRDVNFLGQVTHDRRQECVAAVMACDGAYFARVTKSDHFGGGISRIAYLHEMAQTKLAPCPSGPVTADSFRVYEALEAGCIPILDGIDGKGRDATNLWHLIFGPQCPLPIIHDWAKLPTMIEVLLEDWETRAAMIGRWWKDRKQQWVDEMAADVKAIS